MAPSRPRRHAAQPPTLKQIALTEKQIEGVLAASKDMDAITEKMPDNAKPDPKITAQLEAVATKNGFASYAEYDDVVDNISMVLAGFDPATKKYVGTRSRDQGANGARSRPTRRCPPGTTRNALADLTQALKAPEPPIENKGNIDLVAKYYDKLAEILGDDQN